MKENVILFAAVVASLGILPALRLLAPWQHTCWDPGGQQHQRHHLPVDHEHQRPAEPAQLVPEVSPLAPWAGAGEHIKYPPLGLALSGCTRQRGGGGDGGEKHGLPRHPAAPQVDDDYVQLLHDTTFQSIKKRDDYVRTDLHSNVALSGIGERGTRDLIALAPPLHERKAVLFHADLFRCKDL